MSARHGRAFLFAFTVFVLSAAPELYPADKTSLEPSRDSIIPKVTQIQRADYEGNRPDLKRLHDELMPIPEDNKLASRMLYWRGFALWRRAINGFNESPTPTDLEEDLKQAVTDFKDAIARDPAFVEPKIGAASSLGYLMFLHRKDPTLMQEPLQQLSPLLKEAMATAPDNPRLLWVLGPIRWSSPPERGGGQDKAFEIYNKGLEAVRNQKRAVVDPLEPSWGEPELLMSLAWSNLNRTTPDLKAAEQYAQSALKLVPYWHYVRDILMPQIQAAQAKAEHPAAEVHGPWLIEPSAIHDPAGPPGFEQYTVVLMKRGDPWNQNAPEFMDVMKQHHAFVEQMTDQGNMAITGPFPFSDQGELLGVAIFRVGPEQTAKLTQDDPVVKAGLLKAEIHPWGTEQGCWRRDSRCNKSMSEGLISAQRCLFPS